MAGDLDSVNKVLRAWYRIVGTESDDDDLTLRGEEQDEIAFYFITIGCREAQRWLLDNGYKDWLKRSAALEWSGTDAADGGRYTDLPTDFLQANGDERESCLVTADGTRWGQQVEERNRTVEGDRFYFRNRQLWLARNAAPPATLYLDYHYMHPAWETAGEDFGDSDIDFPMAARSLIPAEGAYAAKDENWLPRGQDLQVSIEVARNAARARVRKMARYSKEPRKIRKPRRFGNRW